jgi:hypothetical protein
MGVLEKIYISPFEGNHQHPAASARRDRDRPGADAADPGVTAGLNFLEGFVVINVLATFRQVDNDLGFAIGQEPIEVVEGIDPLEVNKVLDEPVQRKRGFVDLKDHFNQRSKT